MHSPVKGHTAGFRFICQSMKKMKKQNKKNNNKNTTTKKHDPPFGDIFEFLGRDTVYTSPVLL